MKAKLQKHHHQAIGGFSIGAIIVAIISLLASLNAVAQQCTDLLNTINPYKKLSNLSSVNMPNTRPMIPMSIPDSCNVEFLRLE